MNKGIKIAAILVCILGAVVLGLALNSGTAQSGILNTIAPSLFPTTKSTMAPTTMAPTTMAPTTMAPTISPLVLLQNRINDIISGKTVLNNLNIVNSLTVQNNNSSDNGTLKLKINGTTSTKNIVSFLRAGSPYNTFGVQNLTTAQEGKPFVLSQPVLVASAAVPTVSSLQTMINNIVSGKQALNNLKVNGAVTVSSTQGYAVYLKNQSSDTDRYDNAIVFLNKNNNAVGGYGVSKVYQSNGKAVYDHISVNSDWGNPSWDARVGGTSAPCTQKTLPPIPSFNATSVAELNSQLDNIINGSVPLLNLVVNGDMTISGDSNSLLNINNVGCDNTNLVSFTTAGRGTNGYGGPFDWIDWGTFSGTTISK